MQVKNIPNTISYKDKIQIRGEIYMQKKDFALLNQKDKKFSTARNAACGSLKQIDFNITKSRPLMFIAYDVICNEKLLLWHWNLDVEFMRLLQQMA